MILYERTKLLPCPSFFLSHNGCWIVGGAVKYLLGETESFKDVGVLCPFELWESISKSIPMDTKLNTFRGFKIRDDADKVDLWPGDILKFLQRKDTVYKKAICLRDSLVLNLSEGFVK